MTDAPELPETDSPDPPPVITRKATRRITYASISFCMAIVAFTLSPLADKDSALHLNAQSAAFWLFTVLLFTVNVIRAATDLLPFMPFVGTLRK